jgi:hypothetical protein
VKLGPSISRRVGSSKIDDLRSVARHRNLCGKNRIISPHAGPNSLRIAILPEPANVTFNHAWMLRQDQNTTLIGQRFNNGAKATHSVDEGHRDQIIQ